MARTKAAAAKWVEVAKGVKVLRLFASSTGPKRPEIAILLMTKANYAKFEKEPMAFVNKHKLFPAAVRRVKRVHAGATEDGPTMNLCSIALNHEPDCSAYYF